MDLEDVELAELLLSLSSQPLHCVPTDTELNLDLEEDALSNMSLLFPYYAPGSLSPLFANFDETDPVLFGEACEVTYWSSEENGPSCCNAFDWSSSHPRTCKRGVSYEAVCGSDTDESAARYDKKFRYDSDSSFTGDGNDDE